MEYISEYKEYKIDYKEGSDVSEYKEDRLQRVQSHGAS
jgi:hypothetical protein